MSRYRLYFLDSRTGSIDRFEEFEARDDDHALDLIGPRIGDAPLELWSGGRKVGRFESALAMSGIASASLWERLAPEPAASDDRRLFGF
jgi:hypothetical protein